MDMMTKVLVFLAAASLVAAGPSPFGFLTKGFEEQLAKVNLKQETADILSLPQRAKRDIPRVAAELKEDQMSEFGADGGKRSFLASSASSYPSTSGDCGKNPLSERTGGRDENIPWMAVLGNDPEGDKEATVDCPGFIVSARHVIGPALCIKANNVNFVMVPTRTGVTTVKVATTNYVPEISNDLDFLLGKNLAIVELNSSLAFSDRVQPACLPPEDATSFINVKYRKTFVYGFLTKDGNFGKFYLPTETYDSAAIRKYIEEFNKREPSRELEVIHFLTKDHLGVLHDYGELRHSGLFYQDASDHRFYLLGIGPIGARLDDPVGVYVNVAHHRHWIEQVLRQ
ncbi:uncharacterized protein LOC143024957 isoform X1 [Oratosquilla oratoria]|uniref:uncharacterized protein LOC143024957 isoform X1 n=1 Tax=Oratosquilla oratoria TaxID=337810 RepID=UPI003F762E60